MCVCGGGGSLTRGSISTFTQVTMPLCSTFIGPCQSKADPVGVSEWIIGPATGGRIIPHLLSGTDNLYISGERGHYLTGRSPNPLFVSGHTFSGFWSWDGIGRIPLV